MLELNSPDREKLSRHALAADREDRWPAESWSALRALGGLRWIIPRAFGGDELRGPPLLECYEALAKTCMTSAFLLSQRDAACRRLRASPNTRLQELLFPRLAIGDAFATVGLAQLTTSRQHGQPALIARASAGGYVLHGEIPWVSGAPQADDIVLGAATEDGRQILALLSAHSSGVTVGPALELAALQGSQTATVRCDNVPLSREAILAGPTENVLRGEHGGTGGLETSTLALGLAGAAVEYLKKESQFRPQIGGIVVPLESALQRLRGDLYAMAQAGAVPEFAPQLRAQANVLVLRATQAALAVSKGAGFVRQHPAQMWARQALFFLVWSSPWPVTEATLK